MRRIEVRVAGSTDRPVVERLWLLFRHDMSEFTGELPGVGGEFRRERLDAVLRGEPGWVAFLVLSGGLPVGFAFVRGADGPVRVMNSFFVVRGARRDGVGLRAVREVVGRFPGAWEVAFQKENAGAAAFWRRVAADICGGGGWREERRPVPGRPGLPPDNWISLSAGA
ncbi:GNAT family N-acetyltransferase [Streptomyces sp. RFCAC02]|uniref:GNAT family N-acetyltransferase n=1 Tax=Streptomyces sp. RFCAC02 TaxID=2499143 RepID=UPI00101FBDFC|nr:GNAT family N-acetyltransferase [Streptomyces sp. RFCAC02]